MCDRKSISICVCRGGGCAECPHQSLCISVSILVYVGVCVCVCVWVCMPVCACVCQPVVYPCRLAVCLSVTVQQSADYVLCDGDSEDSSVSEVAGCCSLWRSEAVDVHRTGQDRTV